MSIPIYFAVYVPKDLYEPGELQNRWFMRDEAYLKSVLNEINAQLNLFPDENRRIRLERARDLSIIPALNTITSRANLTWNDVADAHRDFIEQGRRWFRSGAATLTKDFAVDFEYRTVLVPLPITYKEAATEGTVVYLDKLAKQNGFAEHPDVWLQSMPLGAGMRPNAVLGFISKAIHDTYPDANYQPDPVGAPNWWMWKTTNAEGKICGTLSVLSVNGGGWYGTWPRVKGFPEQSALALYGAEPYFRGQICGIPDPFHVQFGEQVPHGWGESHEIFAHGIGNVNCHNDMTGLEADSWTALQQQTGPFNSMPLAGHWFIEAQTDQLVNAATLDGIGKNDILTKIPKPETITINPDGSFFTPIEPFPQYGRWRFNGLWIDANSKLTTSGLLELVGGVGMHGYTNGIVVASKSVSIVQDPTTPPPPPPPVLERIELIPSSVSMKVGGRALLTTKAYYSDSSSKIVRGTLVSSNAGIVRVDGETIIGVKRGTATVTSSFEGKTATCFVAIKRRLF